MPIRSLFPTSVYTARLGAGGSLNARLLAECRQLRRDDGAGRRWSAANYPGGYTSYASVSRLQTVSPTFAALEQRLDVHVLRFAGALAFDLSGRALAMTDCWINIMPRRVAHRLHLRPLSSLHRSYHVWTPARCPALQI